MQVNGVDQGFAIPAVDGTTNLTTAAVIGNKSDATVQTVGTTASLMAYEKGLMNALIGAGATTFPSSAAPANTVTLGAAIREIFDQSEKVISTITPATMPNATTTIFTVTGGSIKILDLISYCVTTNNTNASTLQFTFDATSGSATTFTGASTSLASLVAGDFVLFDLTLLTTVPTILSTGISGMLGPPTTQRFFITNQTGGVVQAIVGTAATTGTWGHAMRYKPLGRGVTVTAAF